MIGSKQQQVIYLLTQTHQVIQGDFKRSINDAGSILNKGFLHFVSISKYSYVQSALKIADVNGRQFVQSRQ